MKKLLFIILLLGCWTNLFSQQVIQTYTDRCTGTVYTFAVPYNGQAVVTFYNKSKIFTAQEFTNGTLHAWLEQTYAWWNALSPCSTTTTGATATTNTTQQTTQTATNAASAATQNTSQNATSGTTGTTATTGTSQSTTQNTGTTNTDTSSSGTGNTSTDTSSQGSSTSGTGGSETSSSGTESSGSQTDSSSSSSSESSGGSSDSSSSGESSGGSDSSEGSGETGSGEGGSSEEGSGGESSEGDVENDSSEGSGESSEEKKEETKEETKEEKKEEQKDEEKSDEESDESKEEDSEEEKDEEKSDDEESEDDEEEDTKEESDDESEEEDDKKKKKKRNLAPPVVMANVLSQQLPTGEYVRAASFGITQSSLLGTETYGATLMVYDNLQQFMLNGTYSKVHIQTKDVTEIIHGTHSHFSEGKEVTSNDTIVRPVSRVNRVYTGSIGVMKMFTTYMAMSSHSMVWLGEKGSATGLALGISSTSLDMNVVNGNIYYDDVVLGGSLTGFWTKPFLINERLTVAPMTAISSPFISFSVFGEDKVSWNTDLMLIGGSNFAYALTQRFMLNFGVTLIDATIEEFPTMKTFTIGGRLAF